MDSGCPQCRSTRLRTLVSFSAPSPITASWSTPRRCRTPSGRRQGTPGTISLRPAKPTHEKASVERVGPYCRTELAKLAQGGHRACPLPGSLSRFLDDGCVEIDSNVVERAIRPIALNRKNALFAGSDGGGEHWAVSPRWWLSSPVNEQPPQNSMICQPVGRCRYFRGSLPN